MHKKGRPKSFEQTEARTFRLPPSAWLVFDRLATQHGCKPKEPSKSLLAILKEKSNDRVGSH